jgi:hypothetical protein
MKQKIYVFGIVSAIVLITGTMFKVQHWPGAGTLIAAGTVLLLTLFLPAALVNHYKVNGNKQNKLLYITTYVTCFVVFTAMLFKIQHWPFAGYAVIIAVPFPFVIFLPVWLYETSRIKDFDINNTIYILFLLVLQSVFSVLLALNVTREKLDYSLQMTNQLYSFNKKVEAMNSVSGKSSVLNAADDVLAQIDACRQLLFNRTYITRQGLQEGTLGAGDRYLDSRDIPQDVLLASTAPSPAEKLNSSLNIFITEIAKLPHGKEIAEESRDLFDLNSEPGDETAWQFRKFQGVHLTWDLVELDGMENYVKVIKMSALN